MIKSEQKPAFKKALNKALSKFRVSPKYNIQNKMYSMSLRDITALHDYLSSASDQDLKELSKNKLVQDVVEHFQIHLVKSLVHESACRKRVLEQEKKNLQRQKERDIKWAKEREERLRKQQEQTKLLNSIFTRLNLTTEQKEILKKMVDGQ